MENHHFDLTSELVEQIIFAMENQKESFLLDSLTLTISPDEMNKIVNSNSYQLPHWVPSDGYRLMENFVLSLKNPVYKDHLASILHCGHGVFRKYKDALNQRPDIERLWFHFKDKYMRERVSLWYNALRLQWGLDNLSLDYAGEATPVLTDFSIIPADDYQIELINQLDKEAHLENYESFPEDYINDMLRRSRDCFDLEISDESFIYVVESPENEIVGFVWMTKETLEKGTILGRVRQIYVKPNFRGLGLAEKLKEKALSDKRITQSNIVEIDIPEKASFVNKELEELGFKKNSHLFVKLSP